MKSKHGYPVNPGLWFMVYKRDGDQYYQTVTKAGFSAGMSKSAFRMETQNGEDMSSFWLMRESTPISNGDVWSLEYQLMPTQLMQWSDK